MFRFDFLLLYGSTIFGSSCSSLSKLLDVSHRRALRIATGCSKQTPTAVLAVIANEEPLTIKREFIAKKQIAKHFFANDIIAKQLRKINNINTNDKLFSFIENTYIKYRSEFHNLATKVVNHENNITVNYAILNCNAYKKDSTDQELKSKSLQMIHEHYDNCQKVFTDASKKDDICSIGIYDAEAKNKISSKLKHSTSIMSAELTAIYISTEYIKNKKYKNPVIFTDSQSSCRYMINNFRNKNMNNITAAIYNTRNLTIQYVPAHVGIEGNEQADSLAKQAFEDDQVYDNKILVTDAVINFKTAKNTQFIEWYQEELTRRNLNFAGIWNISKKPWFYNKRFTGTEVRKLNRVISGYDYSPFWLGVMKIGTSKICETCQANNTTEHATVTCVKYNNQRAKFKLNQYANFKEIFYGLEYNKLKTLLDFLKEINYDV